MKRKTWIIFALVLLLSLLCGGSALTESGDALAEPIVLESPHPYDNNVDETYSYTNPTEAAGLYITFSAETELENGWDYLTITDANGYERSFTGTELAGQTILVRGNSFTLRLTTDGTTTRYGFRIESIDAENDELFVWFQSSFDYEIGDDGTLTVTKYHGTDAEVVIPNEFDGKQITAIGPYAFSWNNTLTHVTLSEDITSILR